MVGLGGWGWVEPPDNEAGAGTLRRAPRPAHRRHHHRCAGTPTLAGGRNDFLTGAFDRPHQEENAMNAIIYLVGLVVVIMFILSVLGLR
jgi:hypothetical protein